VHQRNARRTFPSVYVIHGKKSFKKIKAGTYHKTTVQHWSLRMHITREFVLLCTHTLTTCIRLSGMYTSLYVTLKHTHTANALLRRIYWWQYPNYNALCICGVNNRAQSGLVYGTYLMLVHVN
jgi:hypothetical protein